ncbi:Pape peptide (modular protein) [Thiocapsa sp. KS1]|nr:Pape peptide (modular protein) [Thiocapsa sp. KS1]
MRARDQGRTPTGQHDNKKMSLGPDDTADPAPDPTPEGATSRRPHIAASAGRRRTR